MGSSPGPWRWSESAFCPGWLVDANGDFVVSPMEPAEVDVTEADATLIRLAPDMASMLRELQYLGPDPKPLRCPICHEGAHAPDCRLAALLAELPK